LIFFLSVYRASHSTIDQLAKEKANVHVVSKSTEKTAGKKMEKKTKYELDKR
jgi:hypothetical protein